MKKSVLHEYKHYVCTEEPHFVQRKRLYSVHIFYSKWGESCYEVYYEKKGFPMMYAFSFLSSDVDLEECFTIAWGNINDYKEMFV